MTSFRTDAGGLIDRQARLAFRFDGQDYTGFAGDTLASALLANGVRLVGRSFKYHRPRGFLSAGAEEPNGLVELREGARREPNTRATVVELHDGLRAQSQNRWPSLSLDLMAVNSLAGPIFSAGFYYKTFMWPASFWEKLYEPLIRRAAGLGRAAKAEDPDHYEQAFAHCDVLVVGAGPAGLAAALAAGRSGARVILCDDDFRLGGRLLAERREIDGRPAADWVETTIAELRSLPEVRIFSRTTVFGVYDHGVYGAVERVADHRAEPQPCEARQRLWRIVARRSILAAGAIERPMVFSGNDRPGVMLAGATRAYANRYGVAAGARAVITTSGDDGWRTVADLAAAGVQIAAVVDSRTDIAADHRALVDRLGARLFAGGQVCGTTGGKQLQGVEILGADRRTTRLDADLLAMSNGWNPAVHLTCHLSAKPAWDADAEMFVPGTVPPGMAVAGAAAGRMGLDQALADGLREGARAAEDTGFTAAVPATPRTDAEGTAGRAQWRVPPGKGKAFVDFQHDVTASDIALAHREGYRPVEHLKRYTTLGMATDQGKTSNMAGLAILAETTARSIPDVGTTTFRPPYVAVSMGAVAGDAVGEDYQPRRRLPAHDDHVAAGALFEDFGPWPRPAAYLRPGEGLDGAARREARAARQAAVLFDATPLGKIEVFGRDAETFLERIYCTPIAGLKTGRIRYGAMLTEHGVVLDDGVVARLGPDRFLLSPSSGAALRVYRWLDEWRQGEWPDLDVRLANLTQAFACIALAGPQARAVLARLAPDIDLSPAHLPHMAFTEGTVAGVPARIARVSFTGEVQYEVTVPASYGPALWRLLQACEDVTPIGIEAWLRLRLDKGYIHVGSDSDGTSLPGDVGFGPMVARKAGDFVGKRSLLRPDAVRRDREQLVGLVAVDAALVLPVGAQILPGQGVALPVPAIGRVTSACFSEALGHGIALGRLRGGRERVGETVELYHLGRRLMARVVALPFFDPRGERLHG